MTTFVQLLGTAKANLESTSVPFVSDKRFLLLAFLAFKNDWVSRDQLANLFWSDTDSVSARKNLRHLLSRTRSLDFAQLEGQDDVRWLVLTDVALFQQHLGAGDWQQAIAVYQGHLLAGLSIESPEFEDWLQQESEALQNAYREAALNHAEQLEQQECFEDAGALLARVLKSDLLAEDIVQAYLRVAGKSVVHRLEALRVFEAFKSLLCQELGLEPLEITKQLATALKLESSNASFTPVQSQALEPSKNADVVVAQAEFASSLHNFPMTVTPFVGRDVDLSEIAAYFKQPEIRLLTLIGSGGMGKTRLAIQVALEQAKHFEAGATFVMLASVSEANNIVPAIAAALGLSRSSLETQTVQLKNYLSEKQLLLVLDNFEHLLDGTRIILELLEHCPKLKILVTSREALNLQCEYLIDVAGLDVPRETFEIEHFDSVQLLLRSAKRVNPRFTLEPESKPFVVQICQLLQGSPLAIELASNWLRVLSVQEVAQEIKTSLDFLSVNQPDIPERHRSMRAIFDSSWVLLSEQQQRSLAKLSLLRGGFTLESAARVAGANPALLLGLVSKSLIARNKTRYIMHEALRQYAVQKLEDEQKQAALLELSLLAHDWAMRVAIHDSTRPVSETVMAFELEFENVAIALEWSLQANPQLCASIVCLPWYFWFAAARKPLGMQWLTTLLELPAQTRDLTRANLLIVRSILGMRMVNADQRLDDAQTALEIALEVGDLKAQAQALLALGMACGDLGELGRAIQSLKAALALIKTVRDINLEADCRNELAFLHWTDGDLELARQTFEDLIARCQVTGNKRSLANANSNLAYVYANQGDLETAQRLLEQAIAIYRESLNIANLCASLLTLCNVMFRRGNMGGVHQTLLEVGELCEQVQEPACFSCFYALCAAFEQQRERHAKALRLNAIATAWRSLPGQDFALEELEPNQFKEPLSAVLFGAETLRQFALEASGLSPKEAIRYALGQLELFNDPQTVVSGQLEIDQ